MPSFAELMFAVLTLGAFAVWVVSDVLEEQLLGQARRERQKAVKVRTRHAAARNLPRSPAVALPRAQVHRRRDMHAA